MISMVCLTMLGGGWVAGLRWTSGTTSGWEGFLVDLMLILVLVAAKFRAKVSDFLLSLSLSC